MGSNRPRVPLADCAQCGDPIAFVKLDTGKAMPVNPVPDPTLEAKAGVVAARMSGTRLVGFVCSRDKLPGVYDVYRFRPHYATCEALRTERKPEPPTERPLF